MLLRQLLIVSVEPSDNLNAQGDFIMIKHFKYLFVAFSVIYACINATTRYDVGTEDVIPKTKFYFRTDDISIGSAGGFQSYKAPSKKCQNLTIQLVQGSSPAANITATGAISLPETLKILWIKGDARGFDTLVSSGRQYALPTPAAGTLIRFSLTHAPETSPLAWFQGDLPNGCGVAIEPNSADPFINATFPKNGGTIFIGSRITPAIGFSDLLGNANGTVNIQRHPDLNVKLAYRAPLTLLEPTTFPYAVEGTSMDWIGEAINPGDPCKVTFEKNASLVDPSEASGNAGYFVVAHRSLQLYAADPNERPLAGIKSRWAAGGTSSTKVAPSSPTLTIPKFG